MCSKLMYCLVSSDRLPAVAQSYCITTPEWLPSSSVGHSSGFNQSPEQTLLYIAQLVLHNCNCGSTGQHRAALTSELVLMPAHAVHPSQ